MKPLPEHLLNKKEEQNKPDFEKYNRQLAVMCRLHLRGGEVAIINQFAEDYAEQGNAAPELLEALIELRDWSVEIHPSGSHAQQKASMTIKKATE